MEERTPLVPDRLPLSPRAANVLALVLRCRTARRARYGVGAAGRSLHVGLRETHLDDKGLGSAGLEGKGRIEGQVRDAQSERGEEVMEGRETDVLLVDCISANSFEMGPVPFLACHGDMYSRARGEETTSA